MQYRFDEELIEGLVLSRPNRFVMMVELDGEVHRTHCPSTGRIGGILFENIPCLMSRATSKERKTGFTVEAISTDPPERKRKSWIGINQSRINKYVEHFVLNDGFPGMVDGQEGLEREVRLGNSRIDLKVGNTYLEVKMPLINLPYRKGTPMKGHSKFDSFDRLIKHFGDLSDQIGSGSKAVLLLCFMYDAKPFVPPLPDNDNRKIMEAAIASHRKGLENWQANFRIDRKGVSLTDHFKLDLFPGH